MLQLIRRGLLEDTTRNFHVCFDPLRSCPRLSLLSKCCHVLLSVGELGWLRTQKIRCTLLLSKGRCLTITKTRCLVKHGLLACLKLRCERRGVLRLLRGPLLTLWRLAEAGCCNRRTEIGNCHGLAEIWSYDRLECIGCRLLKRGGESLLWLVKEWCLLLWFVKLDSLRCRGVAYKSRCIRCFLKIESRLSNAWLKSIVWGWLCSEQILWCIGWVTKWTRLLNLVDVEVEGVGLCHIAYLLAALLKCLLEGLDFRVLLSKRRFKLHYFWI